MTSHSEVIATHQTSKGDVFLKRTFWARVFSHMKKDMVAAFQAVYVGVNIMLAALLGVALFLLEFPLVKEFVLYVLVIPLSLFLVIKYLTLLPIVFFFVFLFLKLEHSIIILSFVVPLSFIWVLLV